MNRILLIAVLLFLPVMLHSQTLKAWVNAGDDAFNKKKYSEAVDYYSKALEFETGDLAITMKMADGVRLSKDYEHAATWYGKVVLADKENHFPLALFYYAEMKKYLGMYEESGRLFERYVALNNQDTSYTGIKARSEIEACKIAAVLIKQKPEVEIINAGTPVNSAYSEFGASMVGDTALYFSSLKYLYEPKKEEAYYVSRILKANPKQAKNNQPLPLSIIINEAATHNCNSAFSPDYRFMIFTRCSESSADFSLDCKLYISRLEQGRWSKPVAINNVNIEGYTSTHPTVQARGADGYTLYFASDRPGGSGLMDIWKSDITAALEFTAPVNCGQPINTFDDDMTPFFDTPSHTLYFSSYGHAGLGGMDIFKSKQVNDNFIEPENLGTAYNSSYNDVYYTLNRDTISGTLTSNRYGSMYLQNRTCCYDIYFFSKIKTVERDSQQVALVADSSAIENVTNLSTRVFYDNFLPLQLYFENDEPDRKSTKTITGTDYETLYQDYISRIEEYRTNFSAKLSGDDKYQAEEDINKFFSENVSASWNTLLEFCSKLEKALKLGIRAELEIRGRASPLAKDSYNVNLSKRRISSLLNFLRKYNNGSLLPYLETHSLTVTEVAAGEALADKKISDELLDKRNSIYNPMAARERRIELINIKLQPPTDGN
jgi:tetratricopeptide (TPR) repeat protein